MMMEEEEGPGADDRIEALIARLARPHRSGGRVIERASLLAAGHDFGAALAWIEAHGGEPELPAAAPPTRGLHSARPAPSPTGPVTPLRFVLPTATSR